MSSRRPPTNNKAEPSHAVADFLDKVAATPVKHSGAAGRLIFAMDATASREPTWDSACTIQSQMFTSTAALGGLQVQLSYYRGFNEFHCEPWCNNAEQLQGLMGNVRCLGGRTQIKRVLSHALAETRRDKVQALIFIGDAVEEDVDQLCHLAGQLGMINVPVFVFQEGADTAVSRAFEQIARLSGGACAPFDHRSAAELRELLTAVAVFAAGGRRALEQLGHKAGRATRLLTQQIKQGSRD